MNDHAQPWWVTAMLAFALAAAAWGALGNPGLCEVWHGLF